MNEASPFACKEVDFPSPSFLPFKLVLHDLCGKKVRIREVNIDEAMTQKLYLTEIILIKVVRVLLGLRLVNVYLRVALHVRVRVHLVIKMLVE